MANQKTSKTGAPQTCVGDRPQNTNIENIMNKPSTSTDKTLNLYYDKEYQVGDIVWAKIGKYPFWPCIVCNDPVSKTFIKRLPKDKKKFSLHVRFFQDNCKRNWVKKLKNYSGKDNFLSKHPNYLAGFRISEKHKNNWNIAVNEADNWFKYKNLEERWVQFSNANNLIYISSTSSNPRSSLTTSNDSLDGTITMANQSNPLKRALEDFPKALIIDLKTKEELNIVAGQNFLIGSSMKCSLIVKDVHISSIQCVIKYENNHFVIYDQSTISNTILNDVRMNIKDGPRELKNGDIVSIENEGKMIYIYRFVLVTKSTKKIKSKEHEVMINKLIVENVQLKSDNGLIRNEMKKLNLSVINLKKDHKMLQKEVLDKIHKHEEEIADLTSLLETHLKNLSEETFKRQINRLLEENLQCSICTGTVVKATICNCSHSFCETCIMTWLRKNRNCPVCRTAIYETTNCLSIDNFIEDLNKTFGGNIKNECDTLKRERAISTSVEGQKRVSQRLIVQNRQV